jgi:hypothetical protein
VTLEHLAKWCSVFSVTRSYGNSLVVSGWLRPPAHAGLRYARQRLPNDRLRRHRRIDAGEPNARRVQRPRSTDGRIPGQQRRGGHQHHAGNAVRLQRSDERQPDDRHDLPQRPSPRLRPRQQRPRHGHRPGRLPRRRRRLGWPWGRGPNTITTARETLPKHGRWPTGAPSTPPRST